MDEKTSKAVLIAAGCATGICSAVVIYLLVKTRKLDERINCVREALSEYIDCRFDNIFEKLADMRLELGDIKNEPDEISKVHYASLYNDGADGCSVNLDDSTDVLNQFISETSVPDDEKKLCQNGVILFPDEDKPSIAELVHHISGEEEEPEEGPRFVPCTKDDFLDIYNSWADYEQTTLLYDPYTGSLTENTSQLYDAASGVTYDNLKEVIGYETTKRVIESAPDETFYVRDDLLGIIYEIVNVVPVEDSADETTQTIDLQDFYFISEEDFDEKKYGNLPVRCISVQEDGIVQEWSLTKRFLADPAHAPLSDCTKLGDPVKLDDCFSKSEQVQWNSGIMLPAVSRNSILYGYTAGYYWIIVPENTKGAFSGKQSYELAFVSKADFMLGCVDGNGHYLELDPNDILHSTHVDMKWPDPRPASEFLGDLTSTICDRGSEKDFYLKDVKTGQYYNIRKRNYI